MRKLFFLFVPCLTLTAASPIHLENFGIAVDLNPDTGAVSGVTNRLTHESWSLHAIPIGLETGQGPVQFSRPLALPATSTAAAFRFTTPSLTAIVRYELPPGAAWVTKTIELRNTSKLPIHVEKLTPEQWEFQPAFQQVHVHRDPSEFRWLINLFLRSNAGGLFCGIENSVYESLSKGSTPNNTYVQLSYQPRLILPPGANYTSDASFLGSFRKEKVYLFKELGKLRHALNQPKAIPSMLNFDQEILDWGEVWAIQDYIRRRQPAHDGPEPGFYVRVVAMVGGHKTNALEEDAGFHIPFGPQHVAGSKRFMDEIAGLGHVPHVEWATEWLGNGGYGNPTPGFALENSTGLRPPANPYWLEVIRYGWGKNLYAGIFETATRNFARSRDDWKVLLANGRQWTWGRQNLPTNCWANRAYAQWRLDVTSQAVTDYRLVMTAWDAIVPADWSWLGWPDVGMQCYATNHGHPPGDIRYAAYRNIIWFLEQLQKRHPRLAMRAASGLTTAYPWVLKNLIEYHPDFYDGETGATYWTSYNFRFLPMYKSGVLLSATRKDEFEWLLLRSISVSDHFMLWSDAVTIARENKPFWDKWLRWADENIAYLRVGRTLFREPWGDEVVSSLPPALEGRLPAPEAAIHGSAHIIRDRGYLFLFNPSRTPRVASIPMNEWIGLTEGRQFLVETLRPSAGQTYAPYQRGEELKIEIPARGALVLHVAPTQPASGQKPTLTPGLPVDKAFLNWNEIPWKEITPVP